jgi:lysophospholipase L1-like esterase
VLDYFALGDYIHLNEKGHRLAAEEVLALLGQELEQAGPSRP